jgi:hypothetical protein
MIKYIIRAEQKSASTNQITINQTKNKFLFKRRARAARNLSSNANVLIYMTSSTNLYNDNSLQPYTQIMQENVCAELRVTQLDTRVYLHVMPIMGDFK